MAHNLLTRRRLIGAAGLGMAGIVSGPLRAAVKPAFRWQDEAAGAAAPIAAACVNHPFVRGLADGSLSEERFLISDRTSIISSTIAALSRRSQSA